MPRRAAGGGRSAPRPTRAAVARRACVALWPTVLDTVRAANAMLGAVVDDARPVELAATVSCSRSARTPPSCAARRRSARTAARSARRCATVTGHALTLTYELREGEARRRRAALSEDELVARLMDEFDAEELGDTDEEGR